jgi:hypothetical protein
MAGVLFPTLGSLTKKRTFLMFPSFAREQYWALTGQASTKVAAQGRSAEVYTVLLRPEDKKKGKMLCSDFHFRSYRGGNASRLVASRFQCADVCFSLRAVPWSRPSTCCNRNEALNRLNLLLRRVTISESKRFTGSRAPKCPLF